MTFNVCFYVKNKNILLTQLTPTAYATFFSIGKLTYFYLALFIEIFRLLTKILHLVVLLVCLFCVRAGHTFHRSTLMCHRRGANNRPIVALTLFGNVYADSTNEAKIPTMLRRKNINALLVDAKCR